MDRLDAEREITRQLESDERLLWSGVPRQGLVLRASDAFLIPFSLLWGGGAIAFEVMTFIAPAPWPLRVIPLMFVLLGLYLMFGRFLVDRMLRERIAYGLTNRRIIIRSGWSSRTVKSLTLRTLSDVTLQERADGTGTITFGPQYPGAQWSRGQPWPGLSVGAIPMFELIPSAKDVCRMIRDAQVKER